MKRIVFLSLILLFGGIINVSAKDTVKLAKCVDGDTARFKLNGEEIKVRFLAINAPEIAHDNQEAEPYGNVASEYTCTVLSNAKEITLEYDSKSDKMDKYGRILAYVYADNKLLQKSLVEKGYAKVDYLYSDYKYAKELLEIESIAKENKIGIWEEKKVVEREYSVWDAIMEFLTTIWEGILSWF